MCRSEACSLPVAAVLPADMSFTRPRAQPMKPKLPRQLAASARINLNRYWHALEELMSCRALDEADNNAVNENLDNERRLAAMSLSGNTSGGSTASAFSVSGKNPSYLPSSTLSSTVLTGTQHSSGSSPMNIDESSSFSKPFNPSPSVKAEQSRFFTSFPDENTPPLNGSAVGGNSSH